MITKIYENLHLYGEINTRNISPIVKKILSLSNSELDYIRIIIDSYGGEISPTFSLIDTIDGSKIPIHTHGLGQCSSAALMILMSGKKGYRSVTKNTSIMSHCTFSNFEGNHIQLQSFIKSSEIERQKQLNHYQEHTKLSKKIIEKELLTSEDVYLTPKEAIQYNIIDKVEKLKND